MTEDEKRLTLVGGTPDEHADKKKIAFKRAYQGRANRHWLFLVLVLLGAIGYALYTFVYSR